MLVACVLSLKGGVGKTTVALGLVSAAIQRDLDTVLVDLDPQGNATSSTGLDAEAPGVADILGQDDPASVNGLLRTSSWGEHLRVLSGGPAAERHNHPDPETAHLLRLRVAMDAIEPQPDLVVIDCPPSLGQLSRAALGAADRAVLVSEPSLYAVAGVHRALQSVQDARSVNPALQPLGVVVNRARPHLAEHEYRLAEMRTVFGPLVLSPALPERSAIQQAQGAAVPIQKWPTAGGREISTAFAALLDRLLRSAAAPAGASER